MSEMGLSFYLYKKIINWFFTFETGLSMGSGCVFISLLPVPHPCFEIGKNSNAYLSSVKAEKTHKFEFGSGGYPRVWTLLPCILFIKNSNLTPHVYIILFVISFFQKHLTILFSLLHKKIYIKSLTRNIWVIQICPFFWKFDDFNFIYGSFSKKKSYML